MEDLTQEVEVEVEVDDLYSFQQRQLLMQGLYALYEVLAEDEETMQELEQRLVVLVEVEEREDLYLSILLRILVLELLRLLEEQEG